MRVTKTIEWDMGHRIPNHRSKCSSLHGHRYKAEICVVGDIVQKRDISDEGMVVDFSDLKRVFIEQVHDVLDHSSMIWEKDRVFTDFFKQQECQKCVLVPFVPTAENIALWIFQKLNDKIKDQYETNLQLHSIRLWETPTSSAICTREYFERIVHETRTIHTQL
jgi:6-pyruvoyltetrahydropterin/6-carboxytetrahydropterin synthase